jgi:AcrR family transcriptional regulator
VGPSHGELVVLEQIKKDSEALNDRSIVIGPFARLDANAVAARSGKTRGAITNLFGSQFAFQAETMALALDSGDWARQVQYRAPGDFPDADTWLDAFLTGESERGPLKGAEPTVRYGFVWALWLSAVPYGLWSEEIAGPSMEELVESVGRLELVIKEALDHFGLALRDGVTVNDLACAFASLIEGVWLNQCLTRRHPTDAGEPIATALRRSGRMIWRGATQER